MRSGRCGVAVHRLHALTACCTQHFLNTGNHMAMLSSPPTVEKRLIEEGEMQTWITRAFGGDRLVLVPTRLPQRTNTSTAGFTPSTQTGQDPLTKM